MDVSESGYSLDAVQMFSAQSEMQILLTFAAKQALFPSGFKLFEDANFVPSSLIMKLEEHLF